MSLLEQMKKAREKAKKKVPRKIKLDKSKKQSWSITICESGENHTGMEILGEKASEGFSIQELMMAKEKFEEKGLETEYFDLKQLGLEDDKRLNSASEAGILIVRNVLDIFTASKYYLRQEMKKIDCDKKYYDVRRSKVLNKNARHNVCFAYFDQEPDIENKKGRVMNIRSLEQLNLVISKLHLYLGEKATDLIGELNHYYNTKKCGIGFHGDTERRIVICIRLGESFPLHYFWYQNSNRVGKRIVLPELNEGDMYIMSDKAVGWDWKLRKNGRLTIRHSAGCDKFTK